MNYKQNDWIGFILLGLSLGIVISTFYFYGFIEDRGGDNQPMLINDELYIITKQVPYSISLFTSNNFTPIINQSNINYSW